MLAKIYRAIVCLHPPYFRQRFAEELLSIFDEAQGALGRGRLVADACFSLLRQWILRSEFWHESVAVVPAGDGVPAFHMLENFRPRPAALVDGALLSAVVFTLVCLVMGYAWNHPVLIRIVQPHWGDSAKRQSHLKAGIRNQSTDVADVPLYTDQGRVFLVFKRPGATSQSASIPAERPQPTVPVSVPEQVLRSYTGTYVAEEQVTVSVSETDGQLAIEVPGQPRSPLVPLSQTKFVAPALSNSTVEFSVGNNGIADRLDLQGGALRLTARRQRDH